LAVGQIAETGRGSGRNDRDGVHLDEEVGMGEAFDDRGRDDRRIERRANPARREPQP
jgi:hypothetical protein